jgi:hypothetical protein
MSNDLPHGCNCNNTSGFVGVSFNPMSRRWQAQITRHNINHFVGLFDTAKEADIARKKFEKRLRRIDLGLAA